MVAWDGVGKNTKKKFFSINQPTGGFGAKEVPILLSVHYTVCIYTVLLMY